MSLQADYFEVSIHNCNSIDDADIRLLKNSLNIKYGPNGVGKSTIARAIVGQIRKDGSLNRLTPFKYLDKPDGKAPLVTGVDELRSALVFDEDYVNQFVFQQDEVVKNSFNIFVRTPEYLSNEKAIEDLFSGIKQTFAENVQIEQTIQDLKDLRDAFGKSKSGSSLPKNSKMYKAFGTGNKIDNVPEALKPFETFIKSSDPSKWIGWQIKGNEYLKLGDTCPYCASPLKEPSQKETAQSVEKEYDAASIGHLNTLKATIDRLGKYFSERTRDNLDKITKGKLEITAQEQAFLSSLKTDIDGLIEKLDALQTISFYVLRDVDEVQEEVAALKIDLTLIDKLESADTRSVIDPLNAHLEQLIKAIGPLKGNINKHKRKIAIAITQNEESINQFLKSAGYKYSVAITPEPGSYRMKLSHEDLDQHIETASRYLSYGEKNAFALVLFMHQVLSEQPDLVVLDDPISSFDKNKKFAILYELFRGKASLRGRTTLMLTHDIEPAIDTLKGTSAVFQGAIPSASFLSAKAGQITEKPIGKHDFQTFASICDQNIKALSDPILKSIYLRRHYEIMDDKGMEYNLLASLLKKRRAPTVQEVDQTRDMTPSEKNLAETYVKKHIPDFNYDTLVSQIEDAESMKQRFGSTEIGYEIIQLFRVIMEHDDAVITKFINESYHIENEYVMQLNPHHFESVPEYVVAECVSRVFNASGAMATDNFSSA